MSVKSAVVVDNVAVIIGVVDTHPPVALHSYVVVPVPYIKGFDTSIGFHCPAKSAVFIYGGNYSGYVRHEIIVVKALAYDFARVGVKIG